MIGELIKSQIKNDSKSILRDPFLRYITPVPLILAIVFIAFQNRMIEIFSSYNINYYQYQDLLISFLILTIGPSMFGMMYGFIFLDYKDEKIFEALELTPIGNGRLLMLKLIIPYGLSVSITAFSLLLVDKTIPLLLLILIVLLSGLNAPLYALILGVIAKNKIQGMSVQKVSGILMIIPIISYFLNGLYVVILGIDPLFWNFQAFWLIGTDYGLVIIYSIIGFGYYLLIIAANVVSLVRYYR